MNCGEPMADDAVAAPNPVIIVEVLSPGTASVDTGGKLGRLFPCAVGRALPDRASHQANGYASPPGRRPASTRWSLSMARSGWTRLGSSSRSKSFMAMAR